MPSFDYIRHHLLGAWCLLRGDEGGFDHFDLSQDGFYRSFWAVAFGLVGLVVILVADHRMGLYFAANVPDFDFRVALGPYVGIEALSGLGAWAMFLVLMVPFARHFGVGQNYGRFVIAYNWASLMMILLSLPLAMLGLSGEFSWDAIVFFQLLLGLVFLIYSWFVAYKGLGLGRLDAAAVIALESVVFLLVSYPARGLYAG